MHTLQLADCPPDNNHDYDGDDDDDNDGGNDDDDEGRVMMLIILSMRRSESEFIYILCGVRNSSQPMKRKEIVCGFCPGIVANFTIWHHRCKIPLVWLEG